MALKNKVATCLLTDVGRVRKNNEDSVGEVEELGLLILADGMGGYNAGEVASGIAVSTVQDVVKREWPNLKHGTIDRSTGYSVEALLIKKAIEEAHAAIFNVSQTQPQCQGMGTTIVVALMHDDLLSIGYVGDSRLYRLRESQLEQVTRDHSLLEELIARGHYNREEANQMVRKNIVTRALGVEEAVKVDLLEDPLEVGDLLLLCSDGLSDLVEADAISEKLNKFTDNLKKAAKELVDEANGRGGKDNISVVLARVDQSLVQGRPWYERLMEWF